MILYGIGAFDWYQNRSNWTVTTHDSKAGSPMDVFLTGKDECPADRNKAEKGHCGCGVIETGDSDADGAHNCVVHKA